MLSSSTGLPPPTTKEKINSLSLKLRVRQRLEGYAPIILGLLSAIWVWQRQIEKEQFENLLKNSVPIAINAAAILAGFQGTIHAMLLAMLPTDTVVFLKKIGLYDRLVGFVRSGILSLLFFVFFALGEIAAEDLGLATKHYGLLMAILCGVFVFAMMSSFRIVLIVVQMLRKA